MIDAGLATTLRREFAGRSEEAIFRQFQTQRLKELEQRERDEKLSDDGMELLEFALVMISASDAREFRLELDRYDAATIAALEFNAQALAEIMKRQEAMLLQAHVLPDGRRVFKTEDGTQVFDEDGTELDPSIVEPTSIADERPTWETYKPLLDEKTRLLAERQELFAYQTRLDEARERLDSGEMTREEFDRVREELKTDMPDAVRAQIPELAEQKAEAEIVVAGSEIELDLSGDMVPGGTTAKAFIPG